VAYVTVAELQRVLNKPAPTQAEQDAMTRVLENAADEIDWDLGYSAAAPAPDPTSPILADVNLDRAAELWRFNYSTSGILPVGPDLSPVIAPRDTWYRHHLRLNPLRTAWGVA
jgi:hypothetical protein